MRDLFDPAGYPASPGFKEDTTSRAAARKIAPRVQTIRDQVLKTLQVAWPAGLTADEVATKLAKREFSIRPRLSELRNMRAIEPRAMTGIVERRKNESGADAIVWVAKRSFGDWK